MSSGSGLLAISLAITSASSETPGLSSRPVTSVASSSPSSPKPALNTLLPPSPMLMTNFLLPVKAMSEGPRASCGPRIDGRPSTTRWSSGPSTSTWVTPPESPMQNSPSAGCLTHGPSPPRPASTTNSSPFGENVRCRGLSRPDATTSNVDWAEAFDVVIVATRTIVPAMAAWRVACVDCCAFGSPSTSVNTGQAQAARSRHGRACARRCSLVDPAAHEEQHRTRSQTVTILRDRVSPPVGFEPKSRPDVAVKSTENALPRARAGRG